MPGEKSTKKTSQENANNVSAKKTLSQFKKLFSAHVAEIAETRVSHKKTERKFRRLDSFARLLECTSICSAVYYCKSTQYLWLANNKVFAHSRGNEWKKNTEAIFYLVSTENLSKEDIVEKLSWTIYKNVKQSMRHDYNEHKGYPIKSIINDLVNNLFDSGLTTKIWIRHALRDLQCDEKIMSFMIKIIKKVSRLTRDFLKLRAFLLKGANDDDSLASGILNAIRNNRFEIIHSENKDVHAEMRIISELYERYGKAARSYIGISKLCCGHCALAMKAFGMNHRGLHGQANKWPLPNFISESTNFFKKYIGSEASLVFDKLSDDEKEKAKKFVAQKKSNPTKGNARSGRYMDADSSDSDKDCGADYSDDEYTEELAELPLADSWEMGDIKRYYREQFDNFAALKFSWDEIKRLYSKSENKFTTLGANTTFELMREKSRNSGEDINEIYEKFSRIYDESPDFISCIVGDEYSAVLDHDLDELYRRYQAEAGSNVDPYDPYDCARDYNSAVQRAEEDFAADYINYPSEDESDNSNENSNGEVKGTYSDTDEDINKCPFEEEIEKSMTRVYYKL